LRLCQHEEQDGGRFPKALAGAEGSRITYKKLTGKNV
jgi:hypothetical protein